MSQATSFMNENSIPVEKKRNWKARIISSVIGGGAATLGSTAFAALMGSEEISFTTCVTVAGVFWGIGTKVAGNVLGSDKMTFVLHQHLIQQSYRKDIERNIGTMLENAVSSIRTNSPFELRKSVYFHIDDKLRFDINKKRRMFFTFSCKVVPPSGTSPRPLDQGVPAPKLPNYDPKCTRTVVTEKINLTNGIYHGFQEGALLGLAGGALASQLFLIFGGVGILLGVMAAIMLVGRISHSEPQSLAPDRAALHGEFSIETQHQINRLLRCADDNAVGCQLDMEVWLTTASPGGVYSKNGVSTIISDSNRIISKKVNETEQDMDGCLMGGADEPEAVVVDAAGNEVAGAAGVVKHH